MAALDSLMAALDQNADVWTAWAAWAGGAWWPANYRFNLEPLPDGRARLQLQVLAAHAKKARG